jgi:hypothetical protein
MNLAYRSFKAVRNGWPFERRIYAVESFATMLPIVFALNGRVRPYNKYLRYELANRPFTDAGWRDLDLVVQLTDIMDTGDPTAQRRIFALIEPAARDLGLGHIVDGWGGELALVQGG